MYFTNKTPITEPIGLTQCLDGTFLTKCPLLWSLSIAKKERWVRFYDANRAGLLVVGREVSVLRKSEYGLGRYTTRNVLLSLSRLDSDKFLYRLNNPESLTIHIGFYTSTP